MTKFNLEQKLEAVIKYQNDFESVRDFARSLGANHEIVRMWIKQFDYHGVKAFEKTIHLTLCSLN